MKADKPLTAPLKGDLSASSSFLSADFLGCPSAGDVGFDIAWKWLLSTGM